MHGQSYDSSSDVQGEVEEARVCFERAAVLHEFSSAPSGSRGSTLVGSADQDDWESGVDTNNSCLIVSSADTSRDEGAPTWLNNTSYADLDSKLEALSVHQSPQAPSRAAEEDNAHSSSSSTMPRATSGSSMPLRNAYSPLPPRACRLPRWVLYPYASSLAHHKDCLHA